MSRKPQFDDFGNRIDSGGDDEPRIEELDLVGNPLAAHSEIAAHSGAIPRGGGEGASGPSDDNYGFGDDVEVIVDDEPEEDISKPLIEGSHSAAAKGETLMIEARKSAVSGSFFDFLASMPDRRRAFAVVGDLHHGKTSLVRSLAGDFAERPDERERCISLKSNLLNFIVTGMHKPKSFLFDAVDTPGHVDFSDEVAAALRLVDGVVLCVDAVEGVLSNTERIIQQACKECLPVLLVVTKVDRLILDLKIPPAHAYYKLKVIVDQVNNAIIAASGQATRAVSPHTGTVAFASSKLGFFFTLRTFAQVHCGGRPDVDVDAFAHRLWGDISFDKIAKKFIRGVGPGRKESFVTFVLEPLYKMVAHAITGKGRENLRCDQLSETPQSPIGAAKEAIEAFLGCAVGHAVDIISGALPPARERNQRLATEYAIDPAEEFAAIISMQRAYSADEVVAIGRVVRGRLHRNAPVDIANGRLDIGFLNGTVSALELKGADGWVELTVAYEGQLVYIKGLSESIHSGAVLLPALENRIEDMNRKIPSIIPLSYATPMVRVALEPVTEKEAPQLQKALDLINKTYPGCDVLVEANGERVVTASGELYFDTLMHDLRGVLCKGVTVKLSDPYVPFRESVSEQRGVLAFDGTADCRISIVASAISEALGDRLEKEALGATLRAQGGDTRLRDILRNEFKWDVRDASRVVALGPDRARGSCILVDDTLGAQPLPREIRETIALGFARATVEGPLCGEPVRNVKFSIVEVVTKGAWQRAALLAAAREATHQALYGARPVLLEPIFRVEILAEPSAVDAISTAVTARRGQIVSTTRVAGTQFQVSKALVPAIDLFGFEAKLRNETHGKAFPTAYFDHWATVPGDPFDTSVKLPLLTAARGHQLAADFVLKTRARKGKADIRNSLDH